MRLSVHIMDIKSKLQTQKAYSASDKAISKGKPTGRELQNGISAAHSSTYSCIIAWKQIFVMDMNDWCIRSANSSILFPMLGVSFVGTLKIL